MDRPQKGAVLNGNTSYHPRPGVVRDGAEMDRPGHHGVGPHSLLFQLYRVRPRVVQYGGAAGRAPVPVDDQGAPL